MAKRDEAKPKPRVEISEAGTALKIANRAFPGPRGATALLRVALERDAFADVTAHARESLEAEVCGVFVGRVCEDDEGLWVHVEAIIRGTAAREGSTHVTFTQETWNTIHESLERDHHGRNIVGWYHTHPGFGVEFSEMDLFIQRNFFPDPAQIALVTDPLGGAIAICVNASGGIEYLDRFWVDGREQPCRRPAPAAQRGASSASAPGSSGESSTSLAAIESRLGQLIQALDETRTFYHRMIAMVAMVCCVAVIGTVAYFIRHSFAAENEPPQVNSFVQVPVQVGGKTMLVGLGVVEWKVPDDMNAIMLQLAREKEERAAKEAAAAAAAKDAEDAAKSGASPAAAPTVAPASSSAAPQQSP